MKRSPETVLSDIRKGNGPSLLLLHGDDFQVHTASQTFIDLLVPSEERTLNLEQFDGRSNPWDQIEAALMTPPFFPGKKTVFVEDAPYFLSREHKGELSEKVFNLWQEGKKGEAARIFLDLLFLEGWTQERWEKINNGLSATQVTNLFGDSTKEIRETVDELFAFCSSNGMNLSRRRGGEGSRLMELVEKGLPPWSILLITASHVDRRTRLYRKFEEKGAVLDLSLQRDRSGRISREVVAEFLDRRLKEAQKRIEARAREMVLLRAGEELWSIHQELEKLLLYVGEDPWIRARDVEEVFLDQGEAWIFDLTKSIVDRDSIGALRQLARLMSQGDHPLKLLGTIVGEVRRLLAARQLIEGEMGQKWSKGMAYPQFQMNVLQKGPPLITRSPYGDYMSFQKAENFTTRDLLGYLERIYQADIHLKSTGNSPRMVMERLILEMCQAT